MLRWPQEKPLHQMVSTQPESRPATSEWIPLATELTSDDPETTESCFSFQTKILFLFFSFSFNAIEELGSGSDGNLVGLQFWNKVH